MAYVPTTFVDRSVEFPNRRTLTAVPGQADTFDVARAEGTVFVEGTKLDAANLNAEFGKIKTETDSINTNLSVRYNPDTDTIQALYNGTWYDTSSANLQAYYLFKNGSGLQNGVTVQVADNYGTLSVTQNSISCIQLNDWSMPTFSQDISSFIGQGKKLYIECSFSSVTTSSTRVRGISSPNHYAGYTSETYYTFPTTPANTHVTAVVDIDTYFSATYKYISLGINNANTNIYNAYIK